MVPLEIRVEENALRAEPVRFARRHGGMHPEPARLVGARGNHSALVRSGADYDGLAAQLRPVALLDGREKGVHVHVQYRPGLHRRQNGRPMSTNSASIPNFPAIHSATALGPKRSVA